MSVENSKNELDLGLEIANPKTEIDKKLNEANIDVSASIDWTEIAYKYFSWEENKENLSSLTDFLDKELKLV